MLRSPFAFLFASGQDRDFGGDESELDLLHANHVAVLDGSLAERSPLFAAGNLLVSLKHIHSIAILDANTLDVLWLYGPTNLVLSHHPVLTPAGTILVFNNGVDASEVLEIDPLTYRAVWRYAKGPAFFSASRGSVQRLPNGNTLVTESDRGYAFEVTPSGETVWRFANPDFTEKGERRFIWRMTRFHPDDLPFLRER
jgi:outer membrane protein assembly factor BamB